MKFAATIVAIATAAPACTSLGPMPATTGVSAVAAGRPSFAGQLGKLPGYYLSSAVQEDPKGAVIDQGSVTFEPDRWLQAPGLILGGRVVGNPDSGTYGEPMIGYRTALDGAKRFSLGGIGYGTYSSQSRNGALYSAARGGAEAVADFRVTGQSRIFELHLLASTSLTALDADGEYCIDGDNRYGVDCTPSDPPADVRVSASAAGIYPAVIGGVALDFGHGIASLFHGVRATGYIGGGSMPSVIGAEQTSARGYASLGLSLSLALGAEQ